LKNIFLETVTKPKSHFERLSIATERNIEALEILKKEVY